MTDPIKGGQDRTGGDMIQAAMLIVALFAVAGVLGLMFGVADLLGLSDRQQDWAVVAGILGLCIVLILRKGKR